MFDWATIIHQILAEQRVSARSLSEVSGVERSSLKRFLSGDLSLRTDDLNRILMTLGYQLSFIEIGEPDPMLRHRTKKHRNARGEQGDAV